MTVGALQPPKMARRIAGLTKESSANHARIGQANTESVKEIPV